MTVEGSVDSVQPLPGYHVSLAPISNDSGASYSFFMAIGWNYPEQGVLQVTVYILDSDIARADMEADV